MPLKLVPVVKTPFTKDQFVEMTVFAWYNLWKTIPKKQSIGIFLAQTMIETGGKSVYGNNVGNRKVPSSTPTDRDVLYHMLPNTWEIIKNKKIYFQPPDRQTWFLSHASLQEGVEEHLKFIKSGRYSNAWQYVLSGDVKGYATALKARGYYTAPVEDYIKGMALFYSPYMKTDSYERAIAKLQTFMLNPAPPTNLPVPPPPVEEKPVDDPLDDMRDVVNIDPVKEVHKYVQDHKKLAQPWYQSIIDAFTAVFNSFTKKK